MKFTQEQINGILSQATLSDTIGQFCQLQGSGKELYGTCPFCGKSGKGKGLKVSVSKNLYKCFSCDVGGNSPVSFLMESQKMSYPDALQWLADHFHVMLDTQPIRRKPGKQQATYRDKQLLASGLTNADQRALVVIDDGTSKEVDVYEAGTLDDYGRIIHGDDMIIWYYGLDGKPIMYQKPKSTRFEQLFRVRWQVPELHPDKHGRPVKYKSPYGSGSHLYIPEVIRRIYKEGRKISTLYVQEGEKKTDKACKHGMPSVGIMGIQNIGHNGKLPMEFQLIIQRCQVENVVLLLDADWDQLSHTLKHDQPVEQRPRSFFSAVKNFRDYFLTFKAQDIYLEIYFAHGNDPANKGIDDLLTNVLNGREQELLQDLHRAMNSKTGEGQFLTLRKISTMPDLKLLEYWNIHNIDVFCSRYAADILKSGLKEFMFSRHIWKLNEAGQPELAQPLTEDEQFWEDCSYTDKAGRNHESYRFRYTRAYNFLRNRGFGRIKLTAPNPLFCQVQNKVVRIVEAWEIRDYMMDMARQLGPKIVPEQILDMLYRGGKMYFGPDSMSNIDFINPTFELCDKDYQLLFFQNKYWKITASQVEEKPLADLSHFVWQEKINAFDASLLPPMVTARVIDQEFCKQLDPENRRNLKSMLGKFDLQFTADANRCHFLQFLINASNFYWDYDYEQHGTADRLHHIAETSMHLLSKLTALGYLMHRYRNKSCEKAVICMDGKNSEVGESWGRTGKSLFGYAIGKVIPQAYIGAKNKNLTEDPFWAEEVTEKIDNIFLDDVRANLDFEFFFPVITGRLTVNVKGQKKFTLSENDTPKLLITTNHSISGESSSFRDRQALIAFSDYYNDQRKPIDDFKINFWVEWESDQWNLFYNLMATCLQLYFQHGLIEAPLGRLEMRKLRQFMGEDFLTWANDYFGTNDEDSPDEIYGPNMNSRIPRKEMFDDFLDKNIIQRKFINATRFKKKILAFVKYRGLQFNPASFNESNEPGYADKSNGVEYFTVANKHFNLPAAVAEMKQGALFSTNPLTHK